MPIAIDAGRRWPDATTVAHWPMADGWPVRVADMAAAGQAHGTDAVAPTIIYAGGRGDFIEKGLEACHHWCGRGWRVVAFDWRGQGGSGRPAGRTGVGHIDDFATWVDDLRQIVARVRQGSCGPLVLIGHSMGGHLVLRALAEGFDRCDGAVIVAPMLGFHDPLPEAVAARVAGIIARFAPIARAWRGGEKPGALPGFRQRLLTHDDARYADERHWLEQHPELATGPGSGGWVAAAYRSMRIMRDPARLARVRVPMLCLSADADALVDAAAGRKALSAVPGARLVRFPAPARHELLREADPVRAEAMVHVDAFLADVRMRAQEAG